MIAWNADDGDILRVAYDYNKWHGLPIVYVPLHWRTSQTQPDTAEVSFMPRGVGRVVRRFNQHIPGQR